MVAQQYTNMKDKKHGTDSTNEVDRVIYDYLDTMLNDPSAESVLSNQSVEELPLAVPDNVTPIQPNRNRTGRAEPIKSQGEPKRYKEPSISKQMEKPVALLSESLLRPAPEEKPDQPEKAKEPSQKVAPRAEPQQPVDPPQAKQPLEPKIPDQKPADKEIVNEDVELVKEPKLEVQQEPEPQEVLRPEWAQSRFECLIFSVAGLKLAVPLITLGSIHQIDRKFNALPGQYDWFIGILQTPNSGNIKVLDTALCVMPERYNPASREDLQYVITIHGCAWGLACHQVEQSITLEPDQIKWRSKRGKRPWLAGTVVDHMCSLIDTDGFQEIIEQAEQP